jgi:acyl-CoA synthetase (AMP-forming)/AMP-acid ligase II
VPEVLLEATEEALPDVQPLPAGQVGEIMVAGDQVMQGYWNQPDASAAALRGGWMHTGGAGYLDSAGYVYVVDRIKDMIITGGENVYSAEVEKRPGLAPGRGTVRRHRS